MNEDTHPQRSTRNEISGDTETSVQAGTVYGGIHVTKPRGHGFPCPRQLPTDIPDFVDRLVDLDNLDAFLPGVTVKNSATSGNADRRQAVRAATIAGQAGVGKTALAIHWAHRVRRHFDDGDLYIDLHGYDDRSPTGPADALDYFLRALNVPTADVPNDVESRASLYRSILDGKRLLVMLDNAATAEQVRPLLPGSHSCFVVITSRSRLAGLTVREGATRIALDALPPAESVQLLREVIGDPKVDAEPAATALLAEQCAHLPLALRIVADRALSSPYLSLRALAEELADERSRLDSLATEEDQLSTMRTVFSWSCNALSTESGRLFRLLGLHPGVSFGSHSASALSGYPLSQTRRLLRTLSGVHLLENRADDRYQFHDLLRVYALECAETEEPTGDRMKAIDQELGWYANTIYAAYRKILPQGRPIPLNTSQPSDRVRAFATLDEALDWCETERPNILRIVTFALENAYYDLTWKIAVGMMAFFERRSYWNDWMSTHLTGLAAARRLGDKFAEGWVLLSLADAYWDVRNLGQALKHYELALAASREADDRWGEGFALRGSGLTYEEMGQHSAALTQSTMALQIFREIAERRGEGMSLLSIGNAHLGLGRHDQAIAEYQLALPIFQELGNRWSEALNLYYTGHAYVRSNRAALAETSYRQALDLFRQLGDPRHEGRSLVALADALAGLNDSAGSRRCLEEALAIFDRLKDPARRDIRARLERFPS
jgi:tetratricopeptide (TPR) repeat protein